MASDTEWILVEITTRTRQRVLVPTSVAAGASLCGFSFEELEPHILQTEDFDVVSEEAEVITRGG